MCIHKGNKDSLRSTIKYLADYGVLSLRLNARYMKYWIMMLWSLRLLQPWMSGCDLHSWLVYQHNIRVEYALIV